MPRASLRALSIAFTIALAAALWAPSAGEGAIGKPRVAALQAALWERGHYAGTVDGLRGPLTRAAIREFQREKGLGVTGRAGARTVSALGGPARRLQGVAPIYKGAQGWDVVRLQFLLAWHGFPSGPFDGRFGARVERATLGFQRWARLPADAVAGAATFEALQQRPARPRARLSLPLDWARGDRFGPRANRFHAGIDLPADTGTPVAAVKAGTVVYADYHRGGFGNLVVLRHRYGLTTRYAHLSDLAVAVGEPVGRGEIVGLVGSTGRSSGPHLHLEVMFRGALINPAPLLER